MIITSYQARAVLGPLDISQEDINHWKRKGKLKSFKGKSHVRGYDRENLLEIALLAVFRQALIKPNDARPFIDKYLSGPPSHGSLILLSDGRLVGINDPATPSRFVRTIINIGAVYRLVDGAFEQALEAA